MLQPRVVTLSDVHVHIRPRGSAEFLPKDFSNVTRLADTIVWNPAVDGVVCGESRQDHSGSHGGERHLDADEVLYCTSSEPFGQVSNGIKRGSGPSELKLKLQYDGAAGVVARWFSA